MSGVTARNDLLPKLAPSCEDRSHQTLGRGGSWTLMEGRRKENFSARSESYRARRKTTNPILPTIAVERTQTEAGTHAIRTVYQNQTRPNPFQDRLLEELSQGWGLPAQRTPPDTRKLRTKSPFATQRPDTQFPVVDRQWIPKDTVFDTQESNSPFEDRPVLLLRVRLS